jgi:hypothetical protein
VWRKVWSLWFFGKTGHFLWLICLIWSLACQFRLQGKKKPDAVSRPRLNSFRTIAALASARGFGRNASRKSLQQFLFREPVDRRVGILVVRPKNIRKRRCRLRLRFVHIDMGLQGVDQIFPEILWRDGFVGYFAQRHHGVLVVVHARL